MPRLDINSNKVWQVDYLTDYKGNLIEVIGASTQSENNAIDAGHGDLQFGGKMFPQTTENDVASMTPFRSMVKSNASGSDLYWGGDLLKLYKTSALSSHFAADTFTDTPIPQGNDLCVFGRVSGIDRLLCPEATNISLLYNSSAWNDSWWVSTLGQPALTTAPHILKTFNQPFFLIVSDGNLLHTVDQNLQVKNSRLILPSTHQIQNVQVAASKIYLGVQDLAGGYPGWYEYDPVNETANFYPIYIMGAKPGAGYIDNNVLHVLAADGRMYYFNGNGMQIEFETIFSKKGPLVNGSTDPIHRNGILVQKNEVLFLVGGAWATVGQPNGLYVLDKLTNQFYLRKTFCTGNNDAFQYSLGTVGALFQNSTDLLAGAEDVDNGYSGVYYNTNQFSTTNVLRWQITTPKLPSAALADKWKTFWSFFSMFDTDSFVVKYRNKRINPTNRGFIPGSSVVGGGGTWTSTTTFTSTTQNLSQLEVGDEIQVMSGVAAGYTFHVTAISNNAGTYTITVDEETPNGSGNFQFFATHFKKIAIIDDIAKTLEKKSIPTQAATDWMQFKIEFRGDSPVMENGIIETIQNIKINENTQAPQ